MDVLYLAKHASPDAFAGKFSARIARRLPVYTKPMQKDKDVLCLPIYLLPFLREMVQIASEMR